MTMAGFEVTCDTDDTILLDEIVDDVLLVPVDPAGDGDEEELPRVNCAHA